MIRSLAAAGTAVIFVSHRLDEVSDLCSDVTVFRDGKVTRRIVDEKPRKSDLVEAIVGRELVLATHGTETPHVGEEVLRLEGVGDGELVHDVSLSVHAGQILGLGGLVGSGRSELVAAVYGASRFRTGRVLLCGRPVAFQHPVQAIRAGVGLVPEERRSEGVFLDESIAFNIALTRIASFVVSRFLPFLKWRDIRRRTQDVADRVTVKAENVNQLIGTLSGGNQQKAVVARWLLDPPKLLILDEPSRGVDVGARAELYDVVRELAARGAAVLVISSDNEELVSLCGEVAVMAEGRVVGRLVGRQITEDRILHFSFESDRARKAPTA